jgi:hypothetical protein
MSQTPSTRSMPLLPANRVASGPGLGGKSLTLKIGACSVRTSNRNPSRSTETPFHGMLRSPPCLLHQRQHLERLCRFMLQNEHGGLMAEF